MTRRGSNDDRSSALKKILIPAGVVVLLVASIAGWFFMVKGPQIAAQERRAQCANHLRQLGQMYMQDVLNRGKGPESGGAHYFIDLAARGGAPHGSPVLVCPSDQDAMAGIPTGDGAAALRRVCSFAVRDFARYPITPEDENPWIAADVADHHGGGLNVLFADTSVRYLDRAALGMAAGESIVVGPESSHPELKKICVVPAE